MHPYQVPSSTDSSEACNNDGDYTSHDDADHFSNVGGVSSS